MSFCPQCGDPVADRQGRYCNPCKAAWMREHRRRYRDFSPHQKRVDDAQAIANCYQRRGHLEKQPCRVCGNPEAQKHHSDYNRPLRVIWLCRTHHRLMHAEQRMQIAIAGLWAKHFGENSGAPCRNPSP